jgi:hypothetical protein
VTRLVDRIKFKVDNNRDDTLALAKSVNRIQGSIKSKTKKMMAAISELSIAQANAHRLQEEIKVKELLIKQFHERIEAVITILYIIYCIHTV